MNLNEYIQNINKEKCNDCEFYTNEELKLRPIIIIPPPNKPKIMLISRCPTTNFLSVYKYSERYNSDERRSILFAAAIPLDLIERITEFIRRENPNSKDDINDLFKIFEVAYWTHLHKCPTEKNKFTKECADKCADKWLKEEINKAKEDGIEVIICLGTEVKEWVYKNKKNIESKNIEIKEWVYKNKKNIESKNIEIIYLMDPSGTNAHWYDDNKKYDIKEKITKLMKICQRIRFEHQNDIS